MDSLGQYAADYENYYNNWTPMTSCSMKKRYRSFVEEEDKLKRKLCKGTPYGIGSYEPSMHLAARTGNIQIVRLLLERGVNPNIICKFTLADDTPLGDACIKNHTDIVMLLLEGVPPNYYRADIESKNRFGETALQRTLFGPKGCFIELAKTLIEYGADYKIVNTDGKTIPEDFERRGLVKEMKELNEFIENFETRRANIKGAVRKSAPNAT